MNDQERIEQLSRALNECYTTQEDGTSIQNNPRALCERLIAINHIVMQVLNAQ